jgi:hypothetical protein
MGVIERLLYWSREACYALVMSEMDTTKEAWQQGEIDENTRTQVLEELLHAGDMWRVAQALKDLSDGLEPGQSRTVVRNPAGIQARDEYEALTGTARMAAEAIVEYGVDRIPRTAGEPFQLLENQPTTDYRPTIAYGAATGPGSPDEPIGYVQVQHTGQALQASLGYLDPQTRTDHSMPISIQP